MPKEDRRIIFNNEEIYKALFALCAQKQIQRLPPGEIISLSVDSENSDKINLIINNALNEAEPEVPLEYNRDFLAAALMLFCRGLGIPLPKSARKSVLIKDDQVMLRVQIP